jgi:Pup amidohydrolase
VRRCVDVFQRAHSPADALAAWNHRKDMEA